MYAIESPSEALTVKRESAPYYGRRARTPGASLFLLALEQRDLQHDFDRLRDKWIEETKHSSSLHHSVLHPASVKIMLMGRAVIPLLLKDLSENGTPWFSALTQITGENPVADDHRGRMSEMTSDWINWGKQHGMV